MLRSLVATLLRRVESWLEVSVSPTEVESFLRYGAGKLQAALQNLGPQEPGWAADGALALRRVAQLGLVQDVSAVTAGKQFAAKHDREQEKAWRKDFLEHPPRWRTGVETGTIEGLILLLAEDSTGLEADLRSVVESLLRHVELQRERALENLKARDRDQIWLERHNAVILLVRAAGRYHDPRYLNAALKLNDYAWRTGHRFELDHRHVKYLQALAEVELALRKAGA